MEIISYVQDKPKSRRLNAWIFERRGGACRQSSSITYPMFNTELRSFGAQRIKPKASVKVTVMGIGRGISAVQEFVAHNVKKIGITLAVVAVFVAAGIGLAMVKQHFDNYTGALQLPGSDSSDIETLNKLMATFALEGAIEVDESGNLVDSVATTISYTQPVTYQNYSVRSGDTISGITRKFGLRNISTLISVNDISNVRQLGAGQKLKIPSIDGIIYTVKKGDSLESIVKKYNVKLATILDVNELNTDVLSAGQQLFIPGAAMDSKSLKEAMGELFIMPLKSKFRWSSSYGKRIDPIAGVSSFHTGTDMAFCPTGTPIYAAMSGTIATAGVSRVYGNYVIIEHGNGYQTLYAHMSKIIATKGQWVSQGTKIGLVGSTGYSTGPHLHFTVYKNGKMIDPMTILKK